MIRWTVAGLLISMGLSLALMLVLRPLMRQGFGPRAQYLSWLLVPTFTLATLLPAPPVPLPLVAPQATQALSVTQRAAFRWIWQAQPGEAAPGVGIRPLGMPWSVWAWLAGVAGLGAAVAIQHGRWRRQLRWDSESGRWSLPPGCSPSVVGLLRPRLALPRDFEQRFTEAERAGVLAHEAVHARRRDNLWNLFATGLWALNWFNPLAWWALRAFQRDQELACDAAALARQDQAARDAYRDALLKAFEISPSSALARGWRSTHPLIERLQWVQDGFAERSWLSAGAVLLALSTLSVMAYAVHGGGAWQIWKGHRPAPKPGYSQARLETLSQINGGQWGSSIGYLDVGKTRDYEQRMSWTESVEGRKVYNLMLKVAREPGQPASASAQVYEVLAAAGPGAPVPEVRHADFPADLWQEIELKTRAGDLVRLRIRFEMVDDPREGT